MTPRQRSAEAYRQIRESGLVEKRKKEVFDLIWNHGPMTGAEVARRIKAKRNVWSQSESIRNRISDLRDMGLLIDVGGERDPDTGKMNTLWDWSGEMPEKPEEKLTKYEQGYEAGFAAAKRIYGPKSYEEQDEINQGRLF